ncbi:G-protein coupled receptor 183-like isoform X1 [Mercenaria mercenaria]|uniref:G-protein coupled receptor 183-like isoform X1 n=1 Tax=Mercenaria mercenaria TaxID=6596 RepID=UPI00234E5D6D|nr:G-protein coupled receptor 183-like isoform X1 [Mercenaria mercenaria]
MYEQHVDYTGKILSRSFFKKLMLVGVLLAVPLSFIFAELLTKRIETTKAVKESRMGQRKIPNTTSNVQKTRKRNSKSKYKGARYETEDMSMKHLETKYVNKSHIRCDGDRSSKETIYYGTDYGSDYIKTKYNTAMALYATALAVSDTVALYIGLLPAWLLFVFGISIRTNSAFCKVNSWMIFTSLQLSTWIITAVTIERVVVVWFPFRYRRIEGTRHAAIILTFLCVFLMTLNSHFLYGMEHIDVAQQYRFDRSCTGLHEGYVYFVQHIWPFIDAVVYFFVPSITIIFGNILIVFKVTKSGNMSIGQQTYSTGANNSSRRKSLLPVVFTLNTAFLLTTTPICVFQLVYNFNDLVISSGQIEKPDHILNSLWTILFMLMNINHSINCFVYVAAGSTFRREVCALFCGKNKNCCRV